MKYTSDMMMSKLYRNYQQLVMSTAVVPEVSIGHNPYEKEHKGMTGTYGEKSIRRIDALIMFRDKRWAVEIKVSLSDLKRELAEPEKQKLWAEHTHSFYFFVTPELLPYALEHVPRQYGVMSLNVPGAYGGIQIMRRAKKNSDPKELPYATIRRMGITYGKMHREVQDSKATALRRFQEEETLRAERTLV